MDPIRRRSGVRFGAVGAARAGDGRRTWIEFSQAAEAGDMPPVFVITGEGAELVNYRVQRFAGGQRYMIDRVFDRAELRLGAKAPVIVRIDRQAKAGGRA